MSRLDCLVGKQIARALIHNGDIYLEVGGQCMRHDDCVETPEMGKECGAGTIIRLNPEGDCCASAYIQGVSIAYALVDATVTAVGDMDGGSEDRDGGQVDTWGHTITTTKGMCSLDMRTEHNGYYSGWMNVSEEATIPEGAKALEDFS